MNLFWYLKQFQPTTIKSDYCTRLFRDRSSKQSGLRWANKPFSLWFRQEFSGNYKCIQAGNELNRLHHNVLIPLSWHFKQGQWDLWVHICSRHDNVVGMTDPLSHGSNFLTSIAGLVHVNDLNLTTQILVSPCHICSVYAINQIWVLAEKSRGGGIS